MKRRTTINKYDLGKEKISDKRILSRILFHGFRNNIDRLKIREHDGYNLIH